MRKSLKYAAWGLGAVVMAQMVWTSYSMATGDTRMGHICASISPGMNFRDLHRFADEHGLRPPTRESGVMYLAETRSFGRYACKVTLDGGKVSASQVNFAD